MNEYKKLTKDDVNFPKCCYFFINELLNYLSSIDENKIQFEKIVESTEVPYCYDVISMVIKTLKSKGYIAQIPAYKKEKNESGTLFRYKWKISKEIKCTGEDLPF